MAASGHSRIIVSPGEEAEVIAAIRATPFDHISGADTNFREALFLPTPLRVVATPESLIGLGSEDQATTGELVDSTLIICFAPLRPI